MDTPLRCLIVDDDEIWCVFLKRWVSQCDGLVLVDSCTSAIDAANVLQREDIDLVFLDVEMPEMSGLELLDSLLDPPQIILVTSKERYAFEAFNIGVTDCLQKVDEKGHPLDYDRFLKAVQRACHQAKEATPTKNHVFINTGDGRLVLLDLRAVQWIEAKGDYMHIQTDTKSHLIHRTMAKLEDKLPAKDFVRVHRSFIVREEKIKDIEGKTMVVGNKDWVIPIGDMFKEKLFKRVKPL